MALPAFGGGVRSPLRDVRHIPAGPHGLVRWLARVAFIPAEVLALLLRWGARDDHLGQRGHEQRHVMPLSPAHDEGQRDSIPVDEEAALRAFFSPGPLGSARRFPGRAAL